MYQWSKIDRGDYIESDDKIIKFTGTKNDSQTSLVRTTKPIPSKSCNIDFEARVVAAGNHLIGIGLTTSSPESRNLRIPGYDAGTIGLLSHAKQILHRLYCGQNSEIDRVNLPMATNDILGCHIESIVDNNKSYRICHFTINGKTAGRPCYLEEQELYPTIMLNSPGAIVETQVKPKGNL